MDDDYDTCNECDTILVEGHVNTCQFCGAEVCEDGDCARNGLVAAKDPGGELVTVCRSCDELADRLSAAKSGE